jgi:hypothetical protein
MIGMKVRYEIGAVNLKISNVTPRDAESYVLLTAADEASNEIVFALSHEQAEHLENELYEANRRWKEHSATTRFSLTDGREPEAQENPDPAH